MQLKNLNVGLGITGSFCNFKYVRDIIEDLKKQEVKNIIPIVSYNVKNLDTRFYKAQDFIKMLEETTENKVIDSIVKAEPIGPKNLIDVLIICPCTGNTLGKIVNAITDTPVTMAVKSHIRNNKPVVIGISTNDAMGYTFENIGKCLNTKNFYFIPFSQDDFLAKPKSLVFDSNHLIEATMQAMDNKQIEPIIL